MRPAVLAAGVLPWELEEFTAAELEDVGQELERREWDRWYQVAAAAAWLLAAWVEKPPKPERLLGWPRDWRRRFDRGDRGESDRGATGQDSSEHGAV